MLVADEKGAWFHTWYRYSVNKTSGHGLEMSATLLTICPCDFQIPAVRT